MSWSNKKEYKILEKIKETPNVFTLHLVSLDEVIPSFVSGQFITVYFNDSETKEGKAYSISNTNTGSHVAITIKAMGEFSNRLCEMKEGETLIASDPYGFFFSELEDTPLVFISGGIGITPFRSLTLHYLKNNRERKINLFYSNKTKGDIVFQKEILNIEKDFPNFKVKYFITQENEFIDDYEKGRITPERVLQELDNHHDCEFMLCGSVPFVRDMWNGLREKGISDEKIYTEAFYSR